MAAPYTVKHHAHAAAERDWLIETYGQAFGQDYRLWMDSLALKAAGGNESGSWFDLEEILERIREESGSDWARSLAIFREAGLREKLEALLAVVRIRKPPRRLRAASRALRGLSDSLSIGVGITFEINDPARLLVVRQVFHHANP